MLRDKNMYKRKTKDVWKLFVNYGQGWEEETTEDTKEMYLTNKKAYRENCNYPQKWVRGREKI